MAGMQPDLPAGLVTDTYFLCQMCHETVLNSAWCLTAEPQKKAGRWGDGDQPMLSLAQRKQLKMHKLFALIAISYLLHSCQPVCTSRICEISSFLAFRRAQERACRVNHVTTQSPKDNCTRFVARTATENYIFLDVFLTTIKSTKLRLSINSQGLPKPCNSVFILMKATQLKPSSHHPLLQCFGKTQAHIILRKSHNQVFGRCHWCTYFDKMVRPLSPRSLKEIPWERRLNEPKQSRFCWDPLSPFASKSPFFDPSKTEMQLMQNLIQ